MCFRFGPYGIPITVFPKRDDRTPPQLSLQPETTDEPSTKQEEEPIIPPAPSQSWSSKPPPLFQEGALYPPPLFIRDTYNQTLPQPPPRKIKRPKRRYRCEEPTSIMNAIKLRPRQVLCDKCKGVVSSGGHREARRGPLDLRSEEASRRRRQAEGPMSLELKRLRSDDKGGRAERRSSSGIRVTSSSTSSSSSRLRSAAPSSSSSSSGPLRLKLKSKKVLAKGSADRSKARQVLKNLTRSSQPKDQNQVQTQNQDHPKAMTRAAALQNHNQKVHFTRRLQHLSGTTSAHSALPPRMRLKPQRYRTDEAPCTPTKHSPRSSPPKPAISPALTQDQAPPPMPPSLCVVSVAVEMQAVCPPEERGAHQLGGVGKGQVMEPSPPSSSSMDSFPPSECSSTETFDLPPPGDLPSSLIPPAPASSSSPATLLPQIEGEEEEEEEGSDLKKRRKSSSSPPSSVFSKSVSKVSLSDGRTVCVGDIVWAKIYGFPWWPARVLGITISRRSDTGLAVRQEARVSWFGSPTTSFLPLAQLSPFLETFQSRFDRKRKGPYRRAIAEAASAAKQLTPEVRALLTQFET